jgi:four helix bundle protein
MGNIQNFKDFTVWKDSSRLAVDIYKLCKKLPDSERYGICSQMQRSAVSVPSNIAEGYRRNGKVEFRRFIYISLGSAAELETQLYICSEIYDVEVTDLVKRVVVIQKQLLALQNTLK